MAPNFKGLNNSQKFNNISLILSFNRNQFFKKVDYQILLAKIKLSQMLWLS